MLTLAQSQPSGQRPLRDLSNADVRRDLTPSALEAFARISEFWRLSSKQSTALIGEIDEGVWFRIKGREWSGELSHDALMRLSAIIGLYKGLHLLFSEQTANDWVRKPNTETLFGGQSPVEFMIAGGVQAMMQARGYIDALRGGL